MQLLDYGSSLWPSKLIYCQRPFILAWISFPTHCSFLADILAFHLKPVSYSLLFHALPLHIHCAFLHRLTVISSSVPQRSTPGIRAQRGDPGAGHGLCFLLQNLEGIRSDVLRCWLTLLLPLLLPLLTLKLCGFIHPAEQLSLPKGQLARSIEKLSHALRNWSLSLHRDLYPCMYCGFQSRTY